MVSVEDVSARLNEFMRNQQLANDRFEPHGERQDVTNTELREASIELIKRTAKLEEDAAKTETGTARLEEPLAFQVERIGGESQEIRELKENMAIDSHGLRGPRSC